MYHGKVLCFNLHPLFGVDGNVEHPNSDYERAASLERHIPLAFETFKEPALEDSAPVATPFHPAMLGVSRATASYELFCMLGLAPDVVACSGCGLR